MMPQISELKILNLGTSVDKGGKVDAIIIKVLWRGAQKNVVIAKQHIFNNLVQADAQTEIKNLVESKGA